MTSIFTFEQDSGELIKVHQLEIPIEQRIKRFWLGKW